jgi:DNA polymerase V
VGSVGERTYIAIDLKSFYASVECRERNLDPLTTNLVVADISRTEKTICLAVSPSLKAYGISGRARLFEVVQRVREVNNQRRKLAPGHKFTGKSSNAIELAAHPELELDYIVAPPQMAHYIKRSTEVYQVYLKYVAPEDIHVYSIDEVFMDVTAYLPTYKQTAHELAKTIIQDVLNTTGITATAGIGTNLYLAKVAMDIQAKHTPPDEDGVRIAELDEMSYRRLLWEHTPLTDFWRVGRGYAKKLEQHHIHTMGDVARCSLTDEDLLYELFGVNAELLIDHAWGWEPCTIPGIKAYKPSTNSICSGQVLTSPYPSDKARIVTHEMADLLAMELLERRMVTGQLTLTVGYDIENLTDPARRKAYKGPVTTDRYGRQIPKHAHGTFNLDRPTSSAKKLVEAALSLYDRIVDPNLLVRRLTIDANNIIDESDVPTEELPEQLDLFTDYAALQEQREADAAELERERKIQEAMLGIKKKFGKNAVVKAMNLQDGATTISRNGQIGGHKA